MLSHQREARFFSRRRRDPSPVASSRIATIRTAPSPFHPPAPCDPIYGMPYVSVSVLPLRSRNQATLPNVDLALLRMSVDSTMRASPRIRFAPILTISWHQDSTQNNGNRSLTCLTLLRKTVLVHLSRDCGKAGGRNAFPWLTKVAMCRPHPH